MSGGKVNVDGAVSIDQGKAFPLRVSLGGSTVTLLADGTYEGDPDDLQRALEAASGPDHASHAMALTVCWTVLGFMRAAEKVKR